MNEGDRASQGRRYLRYLGGIALLLVILLAFFIVRPQRMRVDFRDEPDAQIALELWISGLNAPTATALAPDGSGRLFIVERAGVVKVVDSNGVLLDSPLLDISDLVDTRDEGGMLSIAFHPGFASGPEQAGSGRFYLTWMSYDAALTVGEFFLRPNSNVVETAHRVILKVPQSSLLHNGGALAFGSDGYLYISVGDGSEPSTQGLEAQSLRSLLGKILRIDVSEISQDGMPYGIPADNPFLGNPGSRPEIYAIGLRNPWRMAFYEGDLWVGDVGGIIAEEINVVQPGGNYGWPMYEGNSFKFLAAGRHLVQGRIFEFVGNALRMNFTDSGRRIPPIAAYEHGDAAAITGGIVVDRRAGLPDILGRYIFADFMKGTISSLEYAQETAIVTPLVDDAELIVFFGEKADGEIIVVSLAGEILRLTSN